MNIKKTALLYAFMSLFSANIAESKTHVVVVKGGDVVQKSKKGKEVHAKLTEAQKKLSEPLEKDEQKIKEKERKLIEEKKKLDKEVEEIQKNSLLSNDAKQRKFDDLKDRARHLEEDKAEPERLIKRLQADAQRLNERMSQMYQEEMGKFDAKIKEVIKRVAKHEGWDLVLMEESIVFANEDIVKTDMIIKELDKD